MVIISKNSRITKTCVDKTTFPSSGQTFIRDDLLMGFALRVTPGSKSFVVEKRIAGKTRRITIGRYPELTVEQARKEAHKLLGQIATGSDPIAEKEAIRMRGVTLSEAFEDFLTARNNLKPRTIYDYRRLVSVVFEAWLNKPLLSINKSMVALRHQQLGEKSGQAYANQAMRILRAIFNFAIVQYEDSAGHSTISENPVARLTQTRSWYRIPRRQTYLKAHQLPAWYQAVEGLRSTGNNFEHSGMIADYLLFLLFTGMRRQEGATLKWSDVDMLNRSFTIANTKNHQPLTLPISSFVQTLLERRKANAINEYIFPGAGKNGYMIEPRTQIVKVMIASQVTFTLHDLRRTFITVAESLDISAYSVKRLVNHKMSNDVTAGYIITDVERLRAPMQKITDYLLKCIGIEPTAEIVPIRPARRKSASMR